MTTKIFCVLDSSFLIHFPFNKYSTGRVQTVCLYKQSNRVFAVYTQFMSDQINEGNADTYKCVYLALSQN